MLKQIIYDMIMWPWCYILNTAIEVTLLRVLQDRVKKAEKISAEQKPSKASAAAKRKLKRKTGVAPVAGKKTPTRKADASGDSSAGSSASASSPAVPRSKSPKSKSGVKTASIKVLWCFVFVRVDLLKGFVSKIIIKVEICTRSVNTFVPMGHVMSLGYG